MKHNKRCQADHSQELGFYTEVSGEEQLPSGICDRAAKHSIVVKEAYTVGDILKTIYRFCDDHFYALQDVYDSLPRHDDLHSEVLVHGSVCPGCGEIGCRKIRSRFRFRKNRL